MKCVESSLVPPVMFMLILNALERLFLNHRSFMVSLVSPSMSTFHLRVDLHRILFSPNELNLIIIYHNYYTMEKVFDTLYIQDSKFNIRSWVLTVFEGSDGVVIKRLTEQKEVNRRSPKRS